MLITVLSTGLVFGITLTLSGMSASFSNEIRRVIRALGADASVVQDGTAGPFTTSTTFAEPTTARVARRRPPGTLAGFDVLSNDRWNRSGCKRTPEQCSFAPRTGASVEVCDVAGWAPSRSCAGAPTAPTSCSRCSAPVAISASWRRCSALRRSATARAIGPTIVTGYTLRLFRERVGPITPAELVADALVADSPSGIEPIEPIETGPYPEGS